MYLRYIVIVLILFAILVVAEQFREADAYYYDNAPLRFTWDGAPLFCVWDSDYTKNAREAVVTWQNALVDNYGEGFHFPAILILPDTPFEQIQQCNVNIIYVEEEYSSVEDLTDENGFTKGGIMIHKANTEKVWIYVFEAKAGVFLTLQEFDDMITSVTMHEMAHALGIGHVISENMEEKLKPWPDTLMWPFGGHESHKTIYSQDLEAFRCLYPGYSWQGSSPELCLTHPTEFPLRLDPFTGKSKFQIELLR